MISITSTLSIDERAITETFVRASGPGGQNVNKVATAVLLRFDTAGSGLPNDLQARLRKLAGKRMTHLGMLLIAVQRFRTQERNRKAARETLIRLIQRAAKPPITRPTAASDRRRLQTKTHRSRVKHTRTAPADDA
jgi:ribosome-associated protein